MKTHRYSSLLALHIGLAVAAYVPDISEAKDTDVYLKESSVSRDDSPNVMLVFDNSGSMDTAISSTPTYKPSIDYCTADLDTVLGIAGANAGKPSDCADVSNRIYWSFSGGVPSISSNTWFLSSKNHCEDSKTALSTGEGGSYGSSKIAGFTTSGSKYSWGSIKEKTDSAITFVDCQPDGSNSDGYPVGTSQSSNTLSAAYVTKSPAFNWDSFASDTNPTLYSGNYMNYKANTALTVTRTRLEVAKDAVKAIIDSNPNVRFGLTVFNYNDSSGPDGGRVLMRVDTMDAARRTTMKSVVDSLTAATWTPLAETMWEVYRYFSGGTVAYGNPSPTQSPEQDSCAQNVSNTACDNGGVYNAISAGDSAYNDGDYIAPFKYECQTGYVIYVTDGDPTNDSAADSDITSLIGKSCDGTSCLDDVAGWMKNNDVYGGLSGKQHVRTFTIGFGAGISADGQALLKETGITDGGGNYYAAEDAASLAVSIQSALTEITSSNVSFTSPSLSINAFNKLYNRDDVYFALFQPSEAVAWTGNLKRFKLCTASDTSVDNCAYGEVIDANKYRAIDGQTSKIKSTAVSYWSSAADGGEVTLGGAGAEITDNTKVPRALYTYRGTYPDRVTTPTATATPVEILPTTGNSVYDAAIADPTILGLPATASASDVTNLINWMRGQDAYDADADTDTTETRSWNFADPLHSRPVALTFGAVPDASGKPDPTKPIIKLFVGTNEGYLRIINYDTGEEEWAFVPSELLSQQGTLSLGTDGDHTYGLDDSPAFLVEDDNNDGVIDVADGDKVLMFIGMRRGGRNLYAFDLTPTSKMTTTATKLTPKLIWAIRGGVDADYALLGQTWSRPKVTHIRAKCKSTGCATTDSQSRPVLIFGGGYDVGQDNSIPAGPDGTGNAIFIVDPDTGQRIWWASSDAGATLALPGMTYSIPSEVATADSDGDGFSDRIYVGDTGGQIWRIDIGDLIDLNSNGGTDGYVFADVGCTGSTRPSCSATTVQHRKKFFYPPDVVSANDPNFAANPLYDLVTIASGDREDPLDLLTSTSSPVEEAVHNRIYAFRDYNYGKGVPSTKPAAITESTLTDTTTTDLSALTGTALDNARASNGWYIDLKESSAITLPNGLNTVWVGEKGLAKTTVFAGVLYVTTFTPANSSTAKVTCQANEGVAKVYAMNYLSSGAVYDYNGDKTYDRFSIVGGGIPSEVVIAIREGGVTALIGTSGGAAQTQVNSNQPRYRTFWFDE